LLSIPIIGLPFWGLAQAAISGLIVNILKRNRKKKEAVYLYGQEVFDYNANPESITISAEKQKYEITTPSLDAQHPQKAD